MRAVVQLVVVAALGAGIGAVWMFREPISERVPIVGKVLLPGGGAPQPGGGRAAGFAQPVETVKATTREMVTTLEAIGTAQANEAVRVTGKIAGIVTKITFLEAQRVQAGAVLVELDPTETDARIAELRAARDNLAQSLERARALYETRSIPLARVDDLRMQVEAADARIRAAQALRADNVIRAPFAGKLGLRNVSLGALVRPGDVITTLDDTSVIKLDFEAPETALAGIRLGNRIVATAAAVPGRVFEGEVATIDSRVDPVTRSVKVRALLPNPEDLLKPGMLMTTTVIINRRPDAVTIPEEAVLIQGGRQVVYTVRDGKAARAAVKLGARQPGFVEVLEGVPAGADVIVGGLQQVRDGLPVRPAVAGAPPRPGTPPRPAAGG
jgi:membrane fusion protein (multidrug efflux system)